MSFIRRILERLAREPDREILRVSREEGVIAIRAGELLARIETARGSLRERGVQRGDRVAIVAPNSIEWITLDLALLAEGIISVPLYHRQSVKEIAAVLKETTPTLAVAGDPAMRVVLGPLAGAKGALLEEIAGGKPAASATTTSAPRPAAAHSLPFAPIAALAPTDPVTIRATSGTSGDPKGAVLSLANVEFMLERTSAHLGSLFEGLRERERLFHYLPFCFAGSWILLLTALARGSVLTLGIDPARVAADLAAARPHTFLNVPLLLERMRAGIEEKLRAKGGWIASLFSRAWTAQLRRADGRASARDTLSLALARPLLFAPIRRRLGAELRALICGSAPLARETQLFFEMLGVPVLQVYGLTETTAICTMDRPRRAIAGRVGGAIEGVEMKLSESGEILVRGPNVFAGYWNRPDATAAAFDDGWLRTGDVGDIDEEGRWRIVGRVKSVIVLSSGHNVAPEPLEESLRASLPDARHVVVVGQGRAHIAALFAGGLQPNDVERAIEGANAALPHYQRIRSFTILPDAPAFERACLTGNGKIRRDAVTSELSAAIDALYSGTAP